MGGFSMELQVLTPNARVSEPAEMLVPDGEDEPPSQCPSSAVVLTDLWRPRRQPDAVKIMRFPDLESGPFHGRARFRRKFFPGVSAKLWNDWHWQVSHRIRTRARLQEMVALSEAESLALNRTEAKLPLGITPYYMSLVSPDDAQQPLRRTVIPTLQETVKTPGEEDDPLGEEAQSPVPGLVHRYPDRALLLLSDFCSTYCRYCTRSRVVGHGTIYPSRSRLERALEYLRTTPAIRDVLLSGGDPLVLSDDRLAWILSRLRRIPPIEIIRIGTKVPAVVPQRITSQLVRMLRRYHPLWMSLHFTHPDECTTESYKACSRLADAGIPLGSQTVLLKGINDDVGTMTRLVHHRMKMRVRPYYL
jgi:lysine 2,3-aminomutase